MKKHALIVLLARVAMFGCKENTSENQKSLNLHQIHSLIIQPLNQKPQQATSKPTKQMIVKIKLMGLT